MAGETVELQIAMQACRANWRESESSERKKVWTFITDCYPFHATYQTLTSRIIPVVMMKAIEQIPVFSEADLGDA